MFHKNACKERLYDKRENGGRGLRCMVYFSEKYLFNFFNYFKEGNQHDTKNKYDLNTDILERSITINNESTNNKFIIERSNDIKSINNINKQIIRNYLIESNTHTSKINEYLKLKYQNYKIYNIKDLIELQKIDIDKKINNKYFHKKYWMALKSDIICKKTSTQWLKIGNMSPRVESLHCMLQDRSFGFWNNNKCKFCNERLSIEHVSTKCKNMLASKYLPRHDEIVRIIQLHLINENMKKKKKHIKDQKLEKLIIEDDFEIRWDSKIITGHEVKYNKPDLLYINKKLKRIYIIEVGITCLENLVKVEVEKTRKYEVLANMLKALYHFEVFIVPFVITWDGLTTKYFRKHVNKINITDKLIAYAQITSLKKTLEIINNEYTKVFEEEVE